MNQFKKFSVGLLLTGVAFTGCSPRSTITESEQDIQAINLNFMDSSVRPQDDFFQFVNGGWLDKTEIPADQGRWGSFNELREFNNEAVLKVLQRAAESDEYAAGSDEKKAADFYRIGMDSTLAEKRGIEPLRPWIREIEAVNDVQTLQRYLVKQQQSGGGAFFGVGVNTDAKDSERMALYVSQGGLGMPDRDYYLEDNEKFKDLRKKYEQHVANAMRLAEIDDPDGAARRIMELETRLAKASKTRIELRDPESRYNKFTISELNEVMPSFDWNAYLSDLNAKTAEVIVSTPKFMEEVESIIRDVPPSTWREYLKWKLVNSASPYLSYEFVQNEFEFYGKELQGTEEMRPRWKRVLATTERAIGEAIGKLYTEEHFPQEAKEKAQEMVDNIMIAMGERIRNLEWMTGETKEKALEKLSTFDVKIGFPDNWKDYADLEVDGNPETASYFENVQQAAKFRFDDNINKLGKPIDKKEWFMTPQTVNAYYNPTWNEIVFPAGILQPPFYDYRADAAVNYGGIGGVIGHEISHGFDDSGSRYDAQGNLRNWWQEEDLENFQERTGQLVAQYDAYEPIDGVNVKGGLTLGENIGDLGGLLVAYDGLQLHFDQHGRPDQMDGFTPEQRFFISWATIWRTKSREEALRTQIQTDPHSPAKYRGNGPLENIDAFYEAFGVNEGDGMYKSPENRVRIW
ncbi:M13 family metallopeptidase [Anditalea andensis]|uniref:Endothelin-converting protein n=1 Tax=Anditalea andensis TaxID=1048983 RepID=A0A074L2W3_9BACT|nr:M13 family metallopeptidase [Anditalea andensis]KEO74835.1 endothelin-converting protein [Anditalea andensis]